MFKQAPERGPRSDYFYQMACLGPLVSEMGAFPTNVINTELLELARLASEEERLAIQINNDDLLVDKDTVERAVQMARKIAITGLSLGLVPLEEMLDIAQLFSLRVPQLVQLKQTTKPTVEAASDILNKLLASVTETNNTTWSARVAAVLAYFSALKQ